MRVSWFHGCELVEFWGLGDDFRRNVCVREGKNSNSYQS